VWFSRPRKYGKGSRQWYVFELVIINHLTLTNLHFNLYWNLITI
jgi:hypothetical protein